jgi:alginate O-acetyltransferase complex protein AlgI
MHPNLPLLQLILPLGISFYVFKSISYSIDIFRGDAQPAPDFMHFAAFMALFPELVAGPIVRYGALAEQLRRLSTIRVSLADFSNGIWMFILGLSKKLLIADKVAPLADRLFDGSGPVQAGAAWAGSLAYTMQLYFDFSAYSDMAVGLGLMLGFRFPLNFISPYKATSIADFWNRWHITLSHFLRDYLFIPLGGSRGRVAVTVRNLFITMFLGGLWHGAAWTFIAWGVYHGFLLAVNAVWRTVTQFRLPNVSAVLLTFFAVHLGWVLFRSPTFARAYEIYAGMVGMNGTESLFEVSVVSMTFGRLPRLVDIAGGVEVSFFLVLGLFIAFFAPNAQSLPRRFNLVTGAIMGLLLMLCVGSLGKDTPFIYFQF